MVDSDGVSALPMDNGGGEQGDELEHHQGGQGGEYRVLLSVFACDLLAPEEVGSASKSTVVDIIDRGHLSAVYFLHAGDLYRNDGVDVFVVVLGGF